MLLTSSNHISSAMASFWSMTLNASALLTSCVGVTKTIMLTKLSSLDWFLAEIHHIIVKTTIAVA
jgi:hypothetical protein